MMTNAEYLREARKRMKMSKRQVGAMMARSAAHGQAR